MVEKSLRGVSVGLHCSRTILVLQVHGFSLVPIKIHTVHPDSIVDNLDIPRSFTTHKIPSVPKYPFRDVTSIGIPFKHIAIHDRIDFRFDNSD